MVQTITFSTLLLILFFINEILAWKAPGDDCHKGRRHLEECNVCDCKDGNLFQCSHYRCFPEEGKSRYLECVDKEVKVEDCRICVCKNEAWTCGRKFCFNEREDENRKSTEYPSEKYKQHKVKGERPRRSTNDCYEGQQKQVECNECVCRNSRWECTQRSCIDSEYRELILDEELKDVSCAPNSHMVIDCTYCFCNADGLGYVCIDNFCKRYDLLEALPEDHNLKNIKNWVNRAFDVQFYDTNLNSGTIDNNQRDSLEINNDV